jgi:hypothetical protein
MPIAAAMPIDTNRWRDLRAVHHLRDRVEALLVGAKPVETAGRQPWLLTDSPAGPAIRSLAAV